MPERKNPMATNKKDRPVQEFRLASTKAVVWKNETEKGPRYSVQFFRIFKDGEEWRQTTSFGRDDLLLVAKLADLAHTWVSENQAIETSKSRTEDFAEAF
jgi:hypothetical protein